MSANASELNQDADAAGLHKRRVALLVLCLGVLMPMMDTSIVNVALPTIRQSLHVSESTLVWVVDAYMLSFGISLLPAGRAGDFLGHRRLFLIGVAIFTAASLACGLATSGFMLVCARALQGLGSAVMVPVTLALIVEGSRNASDNAKAMGAYGFVCAGSGVIGLFAGGAITNTFGWRWVFLPNVPIGALVLFLTILLVPTSPGRSASPGSLVPAGILKNRTLGVANLVCILWSGAMSGWCFILALYLQRVLSYNPLQVGLSFLPANILMALLSLGVSARVVLKMGLRTSLVAGTAAGAAAYTLFSLGAIGGTFVTDILPGMMLIGAVAGIVYNPLLLAATQSVATHEIGIASGLINTTSMLGGALGLFVISSIGSAHAAMITGAGTSASESLAAGYRAAFVCSAVCAGAAALASLLIDEHRH